jgi:hypothetical protein
LVGQDQAEVVTAGLGEHVADTAGQVQEVVSFVDVGEGVVPVGFG